MKSETIIKIGSFIIILIVLFWILGSINYELGRELKCDKYETQYYREVGIGGLFGGVQKVKTIEENADGTREICIEWDNYFKLFAKKQNQEEVKK